MMGVMPICDLDGLLHLEPSLFPQAKPMEHQCKPLLLPEGFGDVTKLPGKYVDCCPIVRLCLRDRSRAHEGHAEQSMHLR